MCSLQPPAKIHILWKKSHGELLSYQTIILKMKPNSEQNLSNTVELASAAKVPVDESEQHVQTFVRQWGVYVIGYTQVHKIKSKQPFRRYLYILQRSRFQKQHSSLWKNEAVVGALINGLFSFFRKMLWDYWPPILNLLLLDRDKPWKNTTWGIKQSAHLPRAVSGKHEADPVQSLVAPVSASSQHAQTHLPTQRAPAQGCTHSDAPGT